MCELPLAYSCDERVARKQHKCCECRGAIQPGETYHYHHGVWPDGPAQYKVCSDCESLRTEMDKNLDCSEDVTPFGYIFECVTDSGRSDWMLEYVRIKRKRGAELGQYITRKLSEIKQATQQK